GFGLAIGHREGDNIFIDGVWVKQPPFSPQQTVDEFATILRTYHISEVVGDRYSGEWCREVFRRYGINYRVASLARSDLYIALLPLLNSGRIVLPQSDLLTRQLVGLERRATMSGKEQIDHGRNGHDDASNCVAGVAAELITASMCWTGPLHGRWGN